MEGIFTAFSTGGVWMWLILGIQIAAMAIIIERVIALYIKRKPIQRDAVKNFGPMIRRGEIQQVIEQSETVSGGQPVGDVVKAGAQAAINLGGREEIQGKMDEVLLYETEQIEKRTGFLAMFANVATLAGLLGTITGMIKAFAAVSNASPVEKATLLSNGIAEAMNTTAFGLIVAIPTLLAFSVLSNRIVQLTEDLQQSSLKAFNWLSFAFEPITDQVEPSTSVKNRANHNASQAGL